jgi:anti-sigma factor RsiW
MHATIEQLLAFKEGRASAETARHVGDCPVCRAELARLDATAAAMAGLPDEKPSRDLWALIEANAKERRRTRVAKIAWASSAVAAAVLLTVFIVLGIRVRTPRETVDSQVLQTKRASNQQELKPLISQSQRLEALLRRLDAGTPVLKGRTASAIAELQDQVAIVDLQISLLQTGSEASDQLVRLWQERVKLLTTLVAVRTGRGELSTI